MYRPPPPPDINYLALLAVIVIGVTLGNLLSTWITAQVVAAEAEDALRRANATLTRQMEASRQRGEAQAAQDAAAEARRAEHFRQTRREDATGKRLSQTCADWTRADAELGTVTTRAERSRYCGQYERYVESGVPPR